MFTPGHNPVGYLNSSVHAMDGFKHAHFALAHGCVHLLSSPRSLLPYSVNEIVTEVVFVRRSGDDNVHFQQSALLLDRMTMAEVR